MSDRNQHVESAQGSAGGAEELAPGTHLVTRRRGYLHHGIYAGDGQVIHYIGFKGFLRCGPIEMTSLTCFANGHGISVETEQQASFVGTEIVRRAVSRVGEDKYHLLTNNCEHFCSWCIFGESHSHQVAALLSHPWQAVNAIVGIVCGMCESKDPENILDEKMEAELRELRQWTRLPRRIWAFCHRHICMGF
ncbi:lecithin:retinol acyltransferase [Paraburkholderia sp. BL6669N2]|uniref:lecithin retinol acyltransferase family protein n=1 Tax=Paraburkholderia sp. BL6669N2 TaxID=1938807 RepID=UPI000E246A90|nr:lecithin retinol acyltransferase family protein [Paraburkholderia sp. BL6669N2]REG45506.1 lecithin:retinol acyltransferase [Paraburkholderia sp. BL6669N2]